MAATGRHRAERSATLAALAATHPIAEPIPADPTIAVPIPPDSTIPAAPTSAAPVTASDDRG
jgi:hypothetical protein